MIVPTRAGRFAEARMTDSEVHHQLKFGHQEDVRGFALSAQDNHEALYLFPVALELPRCE